AETIREALHAERAPETEKGNQTPEMVQNREMKMVHSPDYSTVRWGEKTFTFTARQAACVCVMWEAMQDGTPYLSKSYILANAADKYKEKTGLDRDELKGLENCRRFRDVFKADARNLHEAWGTMIVKQGKDCFGFALPAC
ncbi:MAG: hypothetical protein ABIG44_07920, partial [Planctomycetota bacterium]